MTVPARTATPAALLALIAFVILFGSGVITAVWLADWGWFVAGFAAATGAVTIAALVSGDL